MCNPRCSAILRASAGVFPARSGTATSLPWIASRIAVSADSNATTSSISAKRAKRKKDFIERSHYTIVRMLRPAHRVASDLSYLASGELHDSDSYYEFISTVSARNQSEA